MAAGVRVHIDATAQLFMSDPAGEQLQLQ